MFYTQLGNYSLVFGFIFSLIIFFFCFKNINDKSKKIETNILLAYGVYQIEASGKNLFDYIKGDEDSIMGLPIKEIMNYIKNYKK